MRALALAIMLTVFGVWWWNKSETDTGDKPDLKVIEPTKSVGKSIEVDGNIWNYDVIKVDVHQSLNLVPNYTQKMNSEEIMERQKCKQGVNAGFYAEDFKPIGGIVANGVEVKKFSKNSLFNGFLSIEDGRVIIGYGWNEKAETIVQTGPVLVWNGKEIELKLAKDKMARRMAGITSDENLYFLTIFHPDASLDGPMLEELPEIVSGIGLREGIDVDSAINLDGGSASAWYSPTLTLQEWQPVGSWWCIR